MPISRYWAAGYWCNQLEHDAQRLSIAADAGRYARKDNVADSGGGDDADQVGVIGIVVCDPRDFGSWRHLSDPCRIPRTLTQPWSDEMNAVYGPRSGWSGDCVFARICSTERRLSFVSSGHQALLYDL